jgi:hypothetical protein
VSEACWGYLRPGATWSFEGMEYFFVSPVRLCVVVLSYNAAGAFSVPKDILTGHIVHYIISNVGLIS